MIRWTARRMGDHRWLVAVLASWIGLPVLGPVGLPPINPDPSASRALEHFGVAALVIAVSIQLFGLHDPLSWLSTPRARRARVLRLTRWLAVAALALVASVPALAFLPPDIPVTAAIRTWMVLFGIGSLAVVATGVLAAPIVAVACFLISTRSSLVPWGANVLFNPDLTTLSLAVGAAALVSGAFAYTWWGDADARAARQLATTDVLLGS